MKKNQVGPRPKTQLHPAVQLLNSVVAPRAQSVAPNTFIGGGVGGVIGFVIAGPAGAAVGAAVGAFFGGKADTVSK